MRLLNFERLAMSAAFVLVLLALATSPGAASRSSRLATSLCAKQGPAASATWMNASRTCLAFHAKGAPIQVPNDSNDTKWGQLQEGFMGEVTFVDREGKQYPVTNPPTTQTVLGGRAWKLLVMQASLRKGNVTRLKPVLYVPFSTVMATMAGTSFEGQLANARPRPVGPNATSWFKWTFSNNITVKDPTDKYGTLLHGSFVNLFHDAVDDQGSCRPALCEDPSKKSDACSYYLKHFGNSTRMTLNWDTGMHGPTDTELVPFFPTTQRQYMAAFTELYQMLRPSFAFVPRNYSFFAHGTPLGIPVSFTGTLVKAKTATARLC